ncbi:MAG: aspartate aminotransferase family protein [Bacteroidales bacterium]
MSENSKSEEIYRQACEVIPGGVSRNTVFRKPFPHYADKASGCYITDIEGTERIDFANNMAALIHGHAHPAIVDAVTRQLQKGTAYTLASEIEVAFARLLSNRVKGFEKIRFVNSGTEAVMAMIKASRAFTGRPKIAKAEGTYHGTYDFAEVSQTANPSSWGDIDNPASVPLVYGTPKGVLDNVVIFPFNDIERTIAILDRHAGQIACVLIDPVPHRVGLIPAKKEYIEALYDWTRKNGALLVFDEVVTFRVNYGGAQENYPVTPDITALGKIIGGGFPVGAIAGRSDVMKVLDPREPSLRFPHSGTFSANPVTMTAGYVAMELFDHDAVEKLNALTDNAVSQIKEVIRLADVPVSVTGAGSMFRFHLTPAPPATYREAYQTKEAVAVINELLDYMYFAEKILMINTFSCMFSTALTQKETDRLSEGLLRAFKALKPKIENLQQK